MSSILYEFIQIHREEIIKRCRAKVATRSVPPPTAAEIDHGVPLFLDQLVAALRGGGAKQTTEITQSAVLHGRELLLQGFTVSQVVHDYGDVCQSVTDLAMEMNAPISTDDFRTLNRCLDDAIAGAVTATNVPVHPTQLYEAIALVGIAWALLQWRRADVDDLVVLGRYFVLAGVTRFAIEFIRVNVRLVRPLALAHLISLVLVAIGTVMILRQRMQIVTRMERT